MMKTTFWSYSLILFVTGILTMSCVTTKHKIVKEEINPTWNGNKAKSIMIMGVYSDRAFRIAGESVFVEELKSKGINAKTSYDLFPDFKNLGEIEEIMAKLEANDIDAILTVATIESREPYDPSTYYAARGWVALLGGDSYDADAMGRIFDGEAYLAAGNHSLDLGFYDTKDLSASWKAKTKSYSEDEPSGGAKLLADFVYEALKERGLI